MVYYDINKVPTNLEKGKSQGNIFDEKVRGKSGKFTENCHQSQGKVLGNKIVLFKLANVLGNVDSRIYFISIFCQRKSLNMECYFLLYC